MRQNNSNDPRVDVFNAWIAEAKSLRSEAAQADVRFMECLERGQSAIAWHWMGYATFDRLLDSENLCKSHRFAEYQNAVARLGIECVRLLGVDASGEVNKIPPGEPSRQMGAAMADGAAAQEMLAFVNKNGTPPSRQSAENIVRKHYEPIKAPKVNVRSVDSERIDMLERENARLTKENARLKRRIATLTASGPVARAS